MNLFFKFLALSISGLFFVAAQADENTVRKKLTTLMPSATFDSIQPSEVKGLYEVISGSNILYVSDDGKYLLQGKLIDIDARKDLTEEKLAGVRVKTMEKVGEDEMIIFKPKDSKYTISIFTDIDCGYCRKLHKEIDQYLAEGITIQYLFFPRAGKGSASYNKAVSVWCADDRNKALTLAKLGETPISKTCDNPVNKHMQLGVEIGTRGTPMLITANGTVLPGYVPAKKLVEALRHENNI